jgi:hypothetical protein
MICSSTSAPARRFGIRMFISAGFCVVLAVVAALAFRLLHLHGVLAWLVATLPALPIIGQLAATGIFLNEEKDEFQRNLLVQCLLGGTGATLAFTTIWGYLEDFTHAPHLHLTLVYGIFWLFVAVSMPVAMRRYR